MSPRQSPDLLLKVGWFWSSGAQKFQYEGIMCCKHKKLDRFISRVTRGPIVAIPLRENWQDACSRLHRGRICEITRKMYDHFLETYPACVRLTESHPEIGFWFAFTDAAMEPAMIFWQRGETYFGRQLCQEHDDRLRAAAGVGWFWS